MEPELPVKEHTWNFLRKRLVSALQQELQVISEKSPGKTDFRPVGQAVVLREKSTDVTKVFSIDTKHRTLSEESLNDGTFLATSIRSHVRYPVEKVLHVLPSEVQVQAAVPDTDVGRVLLFVRSDPTLLLRRSIAKIGELQDAGYGTAVSNRSLNAEVDSKYRNVELNHQQQSAVSSSLAEGVNIIWGPPGTGKTTVIGNLIAEIVRRDQSVLLVSNTNVAVDHALLSAAAKVSPQTAGVMVRAGIPTKPEVNDAENPPLTLDGVAKVHSQKLLVQLAEVELEIQRQSDAIAAVENEQYRSYLEIINDFPDHATVLAAIEEGTAWNVRCALEKEMAAASGAVEAAVGNVETCVSNLKQAQRELDSTQVSHEARIQLGKFQDRENTLDTKLAEARESHRVATQLVAEQKAAVFATKSLSWRRRRKAARLANKILNMQVDEQSKAAVEVEKLATQRATFLGEIQAERNALFITSVKFSETEHNEAIASVRSAESARVAAVSESVRLKKECTVVMNRLDKNTASCPSSLVSALFTAATDKDYVTAWEKVKSVKGIQEGFAVKRTKFLELRRTLLEKIQIQVPSVIAQCQVLATTTSSLFATDALASAFKRRWDYVVVDEASACLLPFIIACSAMASRGVTLVGDPRQNGPISEAAQKRNVKSVSVALKQDIFTFFNVETKDATVQRPGLTVLTEQYRFPSEIAHVANTFAYGPNTLSTVPQVRETFLFDGLPESPIVLLDVSQLPEDLRRFHSSHGRKSGSWLVGAAIAAHLGKLVPKGASYGVVTVYNPQVKITRELLDSNRLDSVQCGTSHRYQGEEFDLVMFDTCEPVGMQGWASAASFRASTGSWSYSGARLCNVASTRAKSQLAVVLDMRVRAKEGTFMAALKQAALDGFASVVNVADLLPGKDIVEPLTDMQVQELLEAGRVGVEECPNLDVVFMTEKQVYPALPAMLAGARDSVEIWSAFVARNRCQQVLPLLEELVSRGVQVTVHCKPSKELKGNKNLNTPAMFAQLRSSGVTVVEHFGIHTKALVVDRNIGLIGSLNILSHSPTNPTTECMVRLNGANHIKNFISSVESH